MSTPNHSQNTRDLSAFLREQMDVLAQATDKALADSQMQAWLGLMANSPRYSTRNMLLVLFQDAQATHVGSAKYWATLGRHLSPDATQLWVQAPISKSASRPVKHDDTEGVNAESAGTDSKTQEQDPRQRTSHQSHSRPVFIDVPIYDVRSTAGADLPQIPEWRSLSRRADLDAHFNAFAETKGITIKVMDLQGSTQGMSHGGHITLDPIAGTKTFVHELMHELLPHHASWIPAQVREWQAEIGAYLVCARFGVEGLNCPNYLAGWTASGKQVRKQFEIAAKPACELITFVESQMGLTTSEVNDET